MHYNKSLPDLEQSKFTDDNSVKIAPGEGSSTAFGLLRIAEPYGVFDSKQIGNNDTTAWDAGQSGAGSSVTYNVNRSSTLLTAGANAGDYAWRQTRRYFPYVPGKSQLLAATFVFGDHVPGIRKMLGLFDERDGVFFEQGDDGVYYVGIRSSVSGGAVDTIIPQSSWNIDKLDGHGNYNGNYDLTKASIFVVDLQWLGVGRVRFGFNIGGKIYYVHEECHAGVISSVYMRQPSLPVRYEVYNISGTSSSSLEQICSSIISEGGYAPPSFEYSAAHGTVGRAVTVRTPVLAVRPRQSLNGLPNRFSFEVAEHQSLVSTNDIYYEVIKHQDPTTVLGTWSPVGGDSTCEYSTDITAIIGGLSLPVMSGYLASGQGQFSIQFSKSERHKTRNHVFTRNALNDNCDYLVLYATSLGISSTVHSSLSWLETI